MRRTWLQVLQWGDDKSIEIHVTSDPTAGSTPLAAEQGRIGGFRVLHTEEIDPLKVAEIMVDYASQ